MDNMSKKTYWVILAFIGVVAAVLRLWHLGELQQLVFDEVYFSKYGHNYLTGTTFFDVHPPLSKYFIGMGIWIHNHLPWINDPAYDHAELTQLSAWSWRWLNAVTGTALCFVVARMSLYLHPSRALSLIIAALIATEGTFIVESRFGLNNVYIVLFGAFAILYFAKAFQQPAKYRINLILCGTFLGCALSVKWNGLGYALAIWGLLIAPIAIRYINNFATDPSLDMRTHERSSLFTGAKVWEYPLYLLILPLILYFIIWQPHLSMFNDYDFVEMQKQILGYHSNSVTADQHPYCSRWYSWPLNLRPIGYYFNAGDPAPDAASPSYIFSIAFWFWFGLLSAIALVPVWLQKACEWRSTKIFPKILLVPFAAVTGIFIAGLIFRGGWSITDEVTNASIQHFADIHLFANPILFWLAAVAMAAMMVVWIVNLMRWFRSGKIPEGLLFQSIVVFCFCANWLPWTIVTRCLFQYHFMPASLLSLCALAWFIYKGFSANNQLIKSATALVSAAIAAGFIYWLPFQLGFTLSPNSFYARMWLQSWI